jgi:membrane protease YdiL (CAAX protease family)
LTAALKILVYLLATLLVGALAAPWLYWAGQHASGIRVLRFLEETDFQRFFNRSILIAAFALLYPMLRWIGLQRFQSLGLIRNRERLQHLFGGFFLSVGLMSALGAGLVGFGVFEIKEIIPWGRLPGILLTSVVVATLEESLFRGGILGLARQSFSPISSALFTSALFAVVHFLKPAEDKIQDVRWYSGFEILPHAFHQFAEPILVLGLFTTLAILGLLLAHATLCTRSLWLPIGIHAGLIFGKMGFGKLSKRVQDLMPWFGADLTIGFGSVLIMLFLWLLVWILFLRGHTRTSSA